jgi:hypothetical protein
MGSGTEASLIGGLPAADRAGQGLASRSGAVGAGFGWRGGYGRTLSEHTSGRAAVEKAFEFPSPSLGEEPWVEEPSGLW